MKRLVAIAIVVLAVLALAAMPILAAGPKTVRKGPEYQARPLNFALVGKVVTDYDPVTGEVGVSVLKRKKNVEAGDELVLELDLLTRVRACSADKGDFIDPDKWAGVLDEGVVITATGVVRAGVYTARMIVVHDCER